MRISIPEKKISIEEMRASDPRLKDFSDDELERARTSLYSLAQLAIESYIEKKQQSK